MHKSSVFTFFFKYLIPAGAIFSVIAMFPHNFNDAIEGGGFYIQPLVLISLTATATSILFIKLQFAEASKEHVLVKIPFNANKKIQYEDIEWVYQVALFNPALTVIKYKDIITKRHHTFFIASGEMQAFGYLKENQMTMFIRNQIIEANPNYKKENEPNKWKPMIIVYGIFIIAQFLLSAF
jgi:hypothetical protein